MKILFRYLLLAGLSLSMVSFAAVAESIPQVSAPLLCASDSDCDRDPKHLEQFVADFYKWYGASEERLLSFGKQGLSQEERSKRAHIYATERKKVLKESLSPEFLEWRTETLRKEPGDRPLDLRYCSPDGDFIFCAQDWNRNNIQNVSAQMIAMDRKIAVLIVRIPVSSAASSGNPIPRLLSVRMRPLDGTWKIDGVTDLVTDQWRLENR